MGIENIVKIKRMIKVLLNNFSFLSRDCQRVVAETVNELDKVDQDTSI